MITHKLGGGVERHIADLGCLLAPTCEVLVLRPDGSGLLSVEWLREGEDWRCWFVASADRDALTGCLIAAGVVRVHLHHIDGLAPPLWTIADAIGVPLDITLHDHWPLTPRYHLAPTPDAPDIGASADWHEQTGALLASAARVFAPSRYLADAIRRVHRGIPITVWPHPDASAAGPEQRPFKVAIIGRMSPDKGLDVVVACAKWAKDHALPLHFRIIGSTTEAIPVFPQLPLDATGGYDDENLPAIIATEQPDLAFFPSQIPESFSYTLTAAMTAGLPIVAARLGAFIERLQGLSAACLLDRGVSAAAWCDALLALARTPREASTVPHIVPESGIAAYLSAIANNSDRAPPAGAPAAIAPKAAAYVRPKMLETEVELSTADLFRFGVECGQTEARDQLKRRSGEIDERLRAEEARRLALESELHEIHAAIEREASMTQELQAHIQKLQAHIQKLDIEIVENQQAAQHAMDLTRETLEHERDDARAAFNEISASRFWRATAPLRLMTHQLKRLLRFGREAAGHSKSLPFKLGAASQILRTQGPAALGRRVHEKLTRRNGEASSPALAYRQQAQILPLAVPQSATPQVSIIIPVYGQHLMTFTCLKSIAETCDKDSIEVIVIDDCSPEPAASALASVSGVRFIRNETNLGFLKNCNKAAATARGDYVLILNNDVIVTPGWLSAMRETFLGRDDVGMVGAKLIYPDGRLQEAGGIVWCDGSAWNWGRNQDASLPEYNYLREVDYCSGACLMLRRTDWDALGGFDERYAPAYYEDTDLAFRVRESGKRVYYQPAAVVVHFEGQSSGTDLTQGVKKHQVINQQTFVARWRAVLARHRINGLLPRLERDRYFRRRVLVIDACMLTPDQDSGSLRMFELLGVMARMHVKVTFLADNLEFREPYVSQIQALGVEVIYHPVESNVTRFLERHAAEYQVIVLSRATVAVKHIDTVRRVAPRAKILFDTVDLHFLRQEREAALADDVVLRAAAAIMKAQELGIMSKSDVTLVVSPVEQQLLGEIAPEVRVSIISNVHVNMPGSKRFAERRGAIFIGGFRHPPNLDAVTWYVDRVLPILRRKNAGIVTTVIGSYAPPSLRSFAADDFVIAGFVSDVAPYYDNAKLSISPLRYGAGVKGKVNIAMQYGVPVVATTPSVEGMHLRPGVDVLCADDAEAFADAMILANTDATLWRTLRDNGLDNIDTHFSRATARRALAVLLEIEAG